MKIDDLEASILVGSYNQADTLKLLLASLDRQTERNFEVIIADDGSSDGTELLCRNKYSFPILFLTQEDQGFRKSKILNEAVRRSSSGYLIFLDGDTIAERHLVEDHLSLRRPHSFVCGRRVDLGPRISREIQLPNVTAGEFDRMSWRVVRSALTGDTQNIKRAWRIRNPFVRHLLGYKRAIDILGSNFSVWKKDLIDINGFNEDFEKYWGEDGDVFLRLRNSGRFAMNAKGCCIQYHLFHPRKPIDREAEKLHRARLKDREYCWAEHGLLPNSAVTPVLEQSIPRQPFNSV